MIQTYGFEAVNLQLIFKNRLKQKIQQLKEQARQAATQQNKSASTDENAEVGTVAEQEIEEPNLDDDFFCFAYYQGKLNSQMFNCLEPLVKYKDLRLEIIRETFRDLTGKWDRNFVIFPISGQEDIKLMISRFYFLCYEVDAPLKMRHQRFLQKYKSQKLSLEEFVDYDDKIKFNTEEFSLFCGSANQ